MKSHTATHDQEGVPYPPKWRIWLMRALYFLTFIGLAFEAWEYLLFPPEPLDYITGVTFSFWAAYGTLMGIGIRYPLKMLPLILLQLTYKSIWALTVYLPMKHAGTITPNAESFFWVCVTAVIIVTLVIPWGYLFKAFIKPFLKFRVYPV